MGADVTDSYSWTVLEHCVIFNDVMYLYINIVILYSLPLLTIETEIVTCVDWELISSWLSTAACRHNLLSQEISPN